MNERTLVGVCCYAGDAHQVQFARSYYEHHECPMVLFSPKDSPVRMPGFNCQSMGQKAYIGQESLDRQKLYLEYCLDTDADFFLLHDSDSLCLSAKIPTYLYGMASDTFYSNEITEPRPHESPYPKLAFQPPYFFNRESLKRMLSVADRIRAHPITPYVDWYMVALCCEAGLKHAAFTSLEHEPVGGEIYTGNDPWETLAHRIKYCGSTFVHPIKTPEQVSLCVRSRKFYEQKHR